MTSEDGGAACEVLDLSQRQSHTAASTSFADVTAADADCGLAGSDTSWCDVSDDDDDADHQQHAMTSLSTRTSFINRSVAGEEFYDTTPVVLMTSIGGSLSKHYDCHMLLHLWPRI